jgi:hypothetical protein
MRKLLLLLGAASIVLVTAASPVQAKDAFTCNSLRSYDFITVDDLVVPPNGTCIIGGVSTINGNVTVLEGAYLSFGLGQIHGNVKGRGAHTIYLDGTGVDGHLQAEETLEVALENSKFGAVQIQRTPTPFGNIHLFNNTIAGDLQVRHNIAFMVVNHNTVGGDVQVDHNIGDLLVAGNTVQNMDVSENTTGTVWVSDNKGQELLCEGNQYMYVAGPNYFAQTEGQCF